MTKLEELINALATLIVRYHDSQSGVKKPVTETTDILQIRRQSRAYAANLILTNQANSTEQLSGLISACTNKYSGRNHFLHFINHEINFLKSLKNLKEPLSETLFEECKIQISQLFLDFQKLLNTTKSNSCSVTYSKFSTDSQFFIMGSAISFARSNNNSTI